MGGYPSKGTPKDSRLKRNKAPRPSSASKKPFGGNKAPPFTKKKG